MEIEKVKNAIKESGISIVNLSRMSGINRATLYKRLNGVGEFTVSEIVGLTKAMRLTDEERNEIFFDEEVV